MILQNTTLLCNFSDRSNISMTEYSFNGDNLPTVKQNIHMHFKYVGFTYFMFISSPLRQLRAYFEFNLQFPAGPCASTRNSIVSKSKLDLFIYLI